NFLILKYLLQLKQQNLLHEVKVYLPMTKIARWQKHILHLQRRWLILAKNEAKMPLPKLDELFTTEEERQTANLEKVIDIPITEIEDFPNHPFRVIVNDELKEMASSIEKDGVREPALVRSIGNGKYQMISGHRRKKASEIANKNTMPCIVRDLTDEQAAIIMVDSNLQQRQKILFSERAFAYKMKLEAMTHQGKRNDL